MAEVGFIDPNDPRFVATVDALESVAVRRPVHAPLRGAPTISASPRPRSTSARSGASTRWRASAARRRRARSSRRCWRAATRSACCPRTRTRSTGELWGNFPQTYSMVGIDQRRGAPVGAVGHDGVSAGVDARAAHSVSAPARRRRRHAGCRFGWVARAGAEHRDVVACRRRPSRPLEARASRATSRAAAAAPARAARSASLPPVVGDTRAMTNRALELLVGAIAASASGSGGCCC